MSSDGTPAERTTGKTRVLVVDDSALIRAILSKIINSAPDLEVVDTAVDGNFVVPKVRRLNPDVVTLDIDMPTQDGLATLEALRDLSGVHVVMVTATTQATAKSGLNALELGALDILPKPLSLSGEIPKAYVDRLWAAIRAAAKGRRCASPPATSGDAYASPSPEGRGAVTNSSRKMGPQDPVCIGIGSSTGGTTALGRIFRKLPPTLPPILIVQHLPPEFAAALADRLHQNSAWSVQLAEHQMPCVPGHAYLAPGNHHLTVALQSGRPQCMLDDRPAIGHHRPAVNALFDSMAEVLSGRCVAALLTGMGRDGADGMLKIMASGGHTICQDQPTSVVWGMPGAAVGLGAAVEQVPLVEIAERLVRACPPISSPGQKAS